MKMVSDLRVCADRGRHAHGQRHQRRVFGRPGDFEHDHAVFGLDGTIAESLLLERGPDILVGLRGRAEQEQGRQRGSAGGVAQTRQGKEHGNRPLEVLTPSYHSHSSSANAAVTLRT